MPVESFVTELKQLVESEPAVQFAAVMTTDGLLVAHHGEMSDPELYGALLVELERTCRRVGEEMVQGSIEEIFVRSKHGCMTVFPIYDQGYLAFLSKPTLNSTKLHMKSMFALPRLYDLF